MDEDPGGSSLIVEKIMDTEASGFEVGELTTVFARVQGILLSREDAAAAVERLAYVARDLVDSAFGAGASLMDEVGRRTSTGTTDTVAASADALQYRLGEGPCMSAWATVAVQRIDDTGTEPRWTAWCAAVQRLGVRSVLSAPLVFKGTSIGALKVYSTTVDAFTTRDEHRLVLLAGVAATLLGAAQDAGAPQRLSSALHAALADRQDVETATGILMERHGVDHDTARTRLLAASRERRRPLADLARQVLDSSAGPRPETAG